MEIELSNAAISYAKLLAYKYTFLLGAKGKSYCCELYFPEDAFHHLAGLHKLGVARTKQRKSVLSHILNGAIQIPDSKNEDLLQRWKGICLLQTLIETNKIVFRYRKHEFKGSTIRAEYVLSGFDYLFFVDSGFPVSLFRPNADQQKQLALCPKLTVLKTIRQEIKTGNSCEIYRSPNYREMPL